MRRHLKPEPVALPAWLHGQVLAHARATPEVEVCGLVGGRAGRPLSRYPVANIAEEPARWFLMDPAGQIAAMRTMRERGETLWAIYHSHPAAPPEPSAQDLREAAYPEALYLIVGLRPPVIRGFWIVAARPQPVAVTVEASAERRV